MTINLINQNERPTFPSGTSINVPEDKVGGFVCHTIQGTDPDRNAAGSSTQLDTLYYTLTGITDTFNNGGVEDRVIDPSDWKFSVSIDGGIIVDGVQLDYDTTTNVHPDQEFKLFITVTDNGAPAQSHSDTIQIKVTNVDEPPFFSTNVFTHYENTGIGTTVGTVGVVDPEGDAISLSFVSGQTSVQNGALIDPFSFANLVMQRTSDSLNYESKSLYDIVVKATSTTLSANGNIRVTVVDVNDPPTLAATTFSMPKHSTSSNSQCGIDYSSPGTLVGTLHGMDEDVNVATGTTDQSQLNYSIATNYPVGCTVQNPVTDINTACTFDLQNIAGSGQLKVLQVTPSITSASTGTVLVTIQVVDPSGATNSLPTDIAITVAGNNFPPCFTFASGITVVENTGQARDGVNIDIGSPISITDDASNMGAIDFTFESSDPSHLGESLITSFFCVKKISSDSSTCSTGSPCSFQLQVCVAETTLDFEKIKGVGLLQGQFKLSVTARDLSGVGESQTQTVTISLTDQPENPDITYGSFQWDENNSPTTPFALSPSIGDIEGIDNDASDQPSTGGQALTYSITSNTNNAPIKLQTDNCFVGLGRGERCTRLIRTTPFDFETQNSYPLQITVADAAGNTARTDFTITVRNINEAPVVVALTRYGALENLGVTGDIGTIVATDPDGIFAGVYSIESGDAAFFKMKSNTGVLELGNSPFDFEVKSLYSMAINATDNGVGAGTASGQTPLFTTGSITVVVGNVNDLTKPVLSNSTTNFPTAGLSAAMDVVLSVSNVERVGVVNPNGLRVEFGGYALDNCVLNGSPKTVVTCKVPAGAGENFAWRYSMVQKHAHKAVLTKTTTSTMPSIAKLCRKISLRTKTGGSSKLDTTRSYVEVCHTTGTGAAPASVLSVKYILAAMDKPNDVQCGYYISHEDGVAVTGAPLTGVQGSCSRKGTTVLLDQALNPACEFKINGHCQKYPSMNNKEWFMDQNYGGPAPTTTEVCSQRKVSWETSCNLNPQDIEMRYTANSGTNNAAASSVCDANDVCTLSSPESLNHTPASSAALNSYVFFCHQGAFPAIFVSKIDALQCDAGEEFIFPTSGHVLDACIASCRSDAACVQYQWKQTEAGAHGAKKAGDCYHFNSATATATLYDTDVAAVDALSGGWVSNDVVYAGMKHVSPMSTDLSSYASPTIASLSSSANSLDTAGFETFTIIGTNFGPPGTITSSDVAYTNVPTCILDVLNSNCESGRRYTPLCTNSDTTIMCTSVAGVGASHRIQVRISGQKSPVSSSSVVLSYTAPAIAKVVVLPSVSGIPTVSNGNERPSSPANIHHCLTIDDKSSGIMNCPAGYFLRVKDNATFYAGYGAPVTGTTCGSHQAPAAASASSMCWADAKKFVHARCAETDQECALAVDSIAMDAIMNSTKRTSTECQAATGEMKTLTLQWTCEYGAWLEQDRRNNVATDGSTLVDLVGTDLGTFDNAITVTYGPSGTEYVAKSCAVGGSNSVVGGSGSNSVRCQTKPGVGQDHVWKIIVDAQHSPLSAQKTSYQRPLITHVSGSGSHQGATTGGDIVYSKCPTLPELCWNSAALVVATSPDGCV